MLCVPNYSVIYKGIMHDAGSEFPIDDADEKEMSRHGKIIDNGVTEIHSVTPSEKKRGGRPKKKE